MTNIKNLDYALTKEDRNTATVKNYLSKLLDKSADLSKDTTPYTLLLAIRRHMNAIDFPDLKRLLLNSERTKNEIR